MATHSLRIVKVQRASSWFILSMGAVVELTVFLITMNLHFVMTSVTFIP